MGRNNQPDYKFYVVGPGDATSGAYKIVGAFEYREDATDLAREAALGIGLPYAVYAKRALAARFHLDPDNDADWANLPDRRNLPTYPQPYKELPDDVYAPDEEREPCPNLGSSPEQHSEEGGAAAHRARERARTAAELAEAGRCGEALAELASANTAFGAAVAHSHSGGSIAELGPAAADVNQARQIVEQRCIARGKRR